MKSKAILNDQSQIGLPFHMVLVNSVPWLQKGQWEKACVSITVLMLLHFATKYL
jgi:hypothetical protein